MERHRDELQRLFRSYKATWLGRRRTHDPHPDLLPAIWLPLISGKHHLAGGMEHTTRRCRGVLENLMART